MDYSKKLDSTWAHRRRRIAQVRGVVNCCRTVRFRAVQYRACRLKKSWTEGILWALGEIRIKWSGKPPHS